MSCSTKYTRMWHILIPANATTRQIFVSTIIISESWELFSSVIDDSLLLLRSWYFFHHNAGHWVPTRVSVCLTVPCAVANVESHSHHSPWDIFAVAFNMAGTEGLFTTSGTQVNKAINGHRPTAFSTIKGKEPALATWIAVIDAKSSRVEDSQSGLVLHLVKKAILGRKR